jgi:DNA-binding response OmpR family regulator
MERTNQQIRILVVEDEKKLAHSLEKQLERAGYKIEKAHDGEEAETKIFNEEFSLIILDLNLPKKSGLEILKHMRERHNTVPTIILSARDKTHDRVLGLELGADDYLVKPFDSTELLARVTAILRRSGVLRSSVLQANDLVLDIVQRTVQRAGKNITLSPKEYSLLEFFVRNKNQILTRRRIAEQVWGYTFDTGTNIVDVYISYLRKAIDDGFSKKLIRTIHGEGFILTEE